MSLKFGKNSASSFRSGLRCARCQAWSTAFACQLRNTFCKNHPVLKLKQLGDVDDLEAWLDKFYPA